MTGPSGDESLDLECDGQWHYRNNHIVGECDCEESDRDRLDDR